MAETASSKGLVRTSVASLACATAAVLTAALVAGREERSPAIAAANGGFALAAAVFATASVVAALGAKPRATPQMEELRTTLDRIARIAQAGTIGDASATEAAFAMIARQARAGSDSLEQRPS